MTDRYVRPSIGSGGDGSSGDPYGTVAAAYSAASSGDTLYIDTSTGVYAPTANVQDTKGLIVRPWIGAKILVDLSGLTATYGWRMEHASSDVEDMVLYGVPANKYCMRIAANIANIKRVTCRDGDGYGIIVSGAGVTTGFSAVAVSHRRLGQMGWRIDGSSGTINLYSGVYSELGNYNRLGQANITVNEYNMVSGGNDLESWLVTAGDLNINNAIMVGCGRTPPQETVRNTGTGAVVITNTAGAYSVQDSQGGGGFLNAGAGTLSLGTGFVGTTGDIGRVFIKPKRKEGCIAFIRDDLEDYITGGAEAGEWDLWLDELEARGFVGSYALSTREQAVTGALGALSAAGWADVASVVTRGHEVLTHGATGYNMHLDEVWMTVQYTGSASVCRLVKTDDSIKTYEDGVIDLNIDLTASGRNLSTVQGIINGDANYTASLETETTTAAPAFAKSLADVDLADIKASPVDLSVDLDKSYRDEVGQCVSDIQLHTGRTPKAHVYSNSSYSLGMASRMVREGYKGARLGGTVTSPLSSNVYKFLDDEGYDPMQSYALLVNTHIDLTNEASIKRDVEAICYWAMWNGGLISIFAHGFDDCSAAQWGHIFDAVAGTGIQVRGFENMVTNIGHTSPSTALSDDVWLDNVAVAGDYASAGTKTWGTAARPVGYDGEPFADFDTSIGPIQSVDVPFHPSKL